MNRMVYRKGIDLQVAVIPALCACYDDVDFVLGGDGPKRSSLAAMIQRHDLADRVEMRGAVQHEDARALLASGATLPREGFAWR